jgi:flavorubredoxin
MADLCRDDMAEAVEDAFRMGKLVVAASSYEGGVFTPMHVFLHHLESKKYQKRKVAIIENGSWAPCAGKIMHDTLAKMSNVEVVEPIVTIWSTMKQKDIPALENLAESILSK